MTAQQLRNSILQQAIQGRLVPQDPNDEPASVLLERIRKEKEQLVKEGKLKKKDLVVEPVSEEEKPFEIPETWEWVRLGEIAAYRKGPFGSSLTKSMFVPKSDSSFKVYEQKNAIQKNAFLGDYYISKEKFESMKSFLVSPGDIIVSCAGTIGETYLVPEDSPVGIINQALMRVKLYDQDLVSFWMLFFEYVVISNSTLKGNGSAIKNIPPFEILKNLPIPLPPLAEQRRIVAKIEELMPLVEKYGKAQTELDTLNQDLPRRLRQSVLQQAIQGKLVEQDPNDEPASVLLESALAVKQRLIKEKKIKPDKLDTPISDDEFLFQIPNGWSWVRLNNVHIIARGGSPRPIKEYLTDTSDGINWIKIGDTEKGGKYINSTREKIKPSGVSKSRMIHKGDFLLTNSMSFGRPYISNVDGCIHDGWLVISPAFGVVFDPDYLYYLLSSPFAYDQFCGKVAGAVVQNLNSDKVATSVFPLPPLAEQRRIVAKIEELFAEIDKLK